MRRPILIAVLVMSAVSLGVAREEKALILRTPTLSKTQIVFPYAGDLWAVSREGGEARRLTTGIGLSAGWRDMSSINRPVTRSVYVMVLKKDLPSPLVPESDDEKAKEEKKDDQSKDKAAADQDKSADKDKTATEKDKGKEAAILDERFNHGGDLADYIIDYLRRPLACSR